MKHLSHFFFLFNLFLFITFLTFGNLRAGDIVITGQLISESTGKPVAYANVLIKETGEGIASSSTGKFSLKSSTLPVTLQISHIAYRTKTIKVTNPDLSIIYLVSTVLTGEEVLVFSSRAVEGKTPVAFSTLDREEIERSYTHQDVPMVLSELPGVYSYSDAGNGVGYSYLKIRGFQQDRIGVMINGIPLNDPEAHAVYWVDHGDILAATGDIQLQRGVGNSLYGASVFGGTVNLATNFHSVRPGFAIAAGYGNYTGSGLDLPSKKISLSYVGNFWKEKVITLYTRFSNLSSDGYRKGSGTEQKSFHAGIE
ncbi:MAG: TonB-dependent receptor, partial [Candidatus Marinimicrobia bacterium]|nr:TonB-dependent receptor [Candidatus Neomarinimicrobiota bacterium]